MKTLREFIPSLPFLQTNMLCASADCPKVALWDCGSCKAVKYCSVEHRKRDDARHKRICGMSDT